jgi:hypothetical protein
VSAVPQYEPQLRPLYDLIAFDLLDLADLVDAYLDFMAFLADDRRPR